MRNHVRNREITPSFPTKFPCLPLLAFAREGRGRAHSARLVPPPPSKSALERHLDAALRGRAMPRARSRPFWRHAPVLSRGDSDAESLRSWVGG